MVFTTVTRRRWLATTAATLAALALRRPTSAAPYESVPGYGSKDEFKKDCLGFKGATFDTGQYSTACTYPDGDVKVCDEHGKNCTYHEAEDGGPPPRPTADPFGTTPLPILTAVETTDGGSPATITPATSGRKGKKGGKRRRR